MIWRRALVLGVALAATGFACRGGMNETKGPPLPPVTVSNPKDNGPGFAERVSLGSLNTRPSYPPDGADAGMLTPSGDAVSDAVNRERARLNAPSGGPANDAGPIVGTPTKLVGTQINWMDPPTLSPDADADALPAFAAGEVGQLVFSSGVSGELVPCGCSPDLRGGLPRAASLLARWRKREPGLVYLDAGDLLFAAEAAPSGPSASQQKKKARALAQGEQLLGAAARVIGARDLAAGGKFVAETAGGVRLLDAGAEVPGARATLLVKAGPSGVPVGIFAAGLGRDPEKTISARANSLREEGARFVVLVLHPPGDRALSQAQRLLPAARAAKVDLVLLAHRDDPALDPNYSESGTPPLVALEGHGQSLLRLDLIFPPGTKAGAPVWMPKSAAQQQEDLKLLDQRADLFRERMKGADPELKPVLQKKIAELQQRKAELANPHESPPAGAIVVQAHFRALSQDLANDPAAKALVASYDKEIADENLASAKLLPPGCPRAKKGEAEFIGVSEPGVNGAKKNEKGESCATCHANEAAFWSRTRHARAYETLVAKDKQFSFDCIACHTTGWQQPGGVCRIDRTGFGGPGLATPRDRTGAGFEDPLPAKIAEGRQGVQCEMCHGPASDHAKTGSEMVQDVPEATCKQCHDAANSPHFEDKTYRPWVVGPGHGQPLAAGESPRTQGEIAAGNKLGPNPSLHPTIESRSNK